MTDAQIAELVAVVGEEVDRRLAAQAGKPAPSLSGKAAADEIVQAVQQYLKRTLDPLVARIQALEERL